MPTPFPGMDPYLEHPALWPDVHTRLITAIADAMTPAVVPRYFLGVEVRTYEDEPGDLSFIRVADLGVAAVVPLGPNPPGAADPGAAVGVLDVEVPIARWVPVRERFLVVRETSSRKLVTILEILSPSNKRPGRGRVRYERKRRAILRSRTHLVEVDLLRGGQPMEIIGPPIPSDYRVLISRGDCRPRARLHAFGVRQPIPTVALPLLPGDGEPPMDLNAILHALYDRARFDLQIDYDGPPTPPLSEADAAWARARLRR